MPADAAEFTAPLSIRVSTNMLTKKLSLGTIALSMGVLMTFAYIYATIVNVPVTGHDAYVHLNWLGQFTTLRDIGLSYPRWLPDSFGGLGAPTFYIYPPLTYFLGSAIASIR